MSADDKFAQWAAQFLGTCAENDSGGAAAAPGAAADDMHYAGLTPAANDLLRAVDAGGIPAFVTVKLKQIAEENGISVSAQWTPNEIIEAIRRQAAAAAPQDPAADV